jgi:hypothetical protein
MFGRIWFRVLIVLLLLAGVAAVGVYAYNAGVARGLAENVAVAAPGAEGVAPVLPYAYGYGGPFFFHRPFGLGWGFGPLGCLFPLLFFLLFFGLLKGAFWGGRWGGRGWGGGWRHHGPGDKGVPEPFAEWHRRMHAEGDGGDKPINA